jgi:hypothetical protein
MPAESHTTYRSRKREPMFQAFRDKRLAKEMLTIKVSASDLHENSAHCKLLAKAYEWFVFSFTV